MARSAKNKMKAWRKNSPGNGQGRQYLAMMKQFGQAQKGLTNTLSKMFTNAGISFKPQGPTVTAEQAQPE